jgi:hypothetical protein
MWSCETCETWSRAHKVLEICTSALGRYRYEGGEGRHKRVGHSAKAKIGKLVVYIGTESINNYAQD